MGIYTRPDSPWWWYRLEGTSIRKSTGFAVVAATPEQTREMKRRAQEEYIDAKAQHARAANRNEKPVIAYQKFSAWYETNEVAHQRGADKARSMLRQLGLYFNRFTSIVDVTEPVAKEWMTWRRERVEPSTVNRELDILKAMLKAAVPLYLDRNPLVGMRRFRVEETEPRVLTREEEDRLLAVCGAEDRALVLTALDTLLRLSSVIQLEWPQVKLNQRVILPLNAKVKTGAKPVSQRLHAALSALTRPGAYVFTSLHARGQDKNVAKNLAIRRFERLCQLANIPHGRAVDGVTFHCLRHTGATRALQAGHSIRTVMNLGGWKDERTVLRYLHATDIDVQSAAESIGHATVTPSKSA